MAIKDYASGLPFWDKLTQDDKDFLVRNAVVRSYKKGMSLIGVGDSCLGMVYILSGSVRVTMISDEGREITLFRLEEGETCLLSASCVLSQITFEVQLLASEDTEMLVVNSGSYERLMENNIYVKSFSYEMLTERFSSVVWVLQQIIFARFDQRLAGFLLSEYEKTGLKDIRMTQEAIAQEVNTAREVVARMLKQFASDGLIELRRGMIIIKDLDGMRDIL